MRGIKYQTQNQTFDVVKYRGTGSNNRLHLCALVFVKTICDACHRSEHPGRHGTSSSQSRQHFVVFVCVNSSNCPNFWGFEHNLRVKSLTTSTLSFYSKESENHRQNLRVLCFHVNIVDWCQTRDDKPRDSLFTHLVIKPQQQNV